jgi:5-methyltetrahydropteroyltriglutamate--homocysteine methyltransferase
LEDAHRHNDLSLFGKFTKSTVILGVVAIARSRVEPVEEIMARVNEILGHIEAERLMLAPDCGLGMLPREIAIGKLEHLVEAARSVG